MIYLDNAATSWPKPEPVIKAMEEYLREYGANPGRGGHRLSLRAGQVVEEARVLLAKLINAEDPMQIVFTPNATAALNQAIKGVLRPGDHVITSSMEHNSVARPLFSQENQGVEVTKIPCRPDGSLPLEALEEAIKDNTRLIALTHASNVTGTIMPVGQAGQIARKHGVLLLVDGAQSLGYLPVDVREMNIDMLAFPGHKGLMGPPGTGGLYIRPGLDLKPLYEGGTGSSSDSLEQPQSLPDRYESGTVNAVGLAGLGAGVKFLLQQGLDTVRSHEEALTVRLLEGLSEIPGVTVYGVEEGTCQAPVVSLNIRNYDSSEVAVILDQVFEIACRSGLHCAPDAHRTIGTLDRGGTVRLSIGWFNTGADIDKALEALVEVASKA